MKAHFNRRLTIGGTLTFEPCPTTLTQDDPSMLVPSSQFPWAHWIQKDTSGTTVTLDRIMRGK